MNDRREAQFQIGLRFRPKYKYRVILEQSQAFLPGQSVNTEGLWGRAPNFGYEAVTTFSSPASPPLYTRAIIQIRGVSGNMGFLHVLAKVLLGILLTTPSNTFAWDEEQGGNGYLVDQGPLDLSQQTQQGDVVMRVRARKQDGGESEVPALDWYKSPLVFPASYAAPIYGGRKLYANPLDWVNERLEVVPGIKKRYMGMEIPEYITKGDGTVVGVGATVLGGGGAPPRGMKQKLLNSG